MTPTIIAVLSSLLALSVGGCAGVTDAGQKPSDDRLTVVAGFYPLAEAAERIGGDQVEVLNLTPAGAEAHDLELTTDQVDAVLDADLVLLLGSGFQPALESAAAQRDGSTLDLLAGREEASAGDTGHAHDQGPDGVDEREVDAGHGTDPHVWLDPRQFAEIAEAIGGAFEDLLADDDGLSERTAAYVETIRQLDLDFETGLARCQRREIVTTHAAFGHLAAAYELRQEPISGLSPESEPDPARLAELSDLIDRTGATAIFVEPLAPGAAGEALARETGVPTRQLHPLEGLTPAQATAGEDYESLMRANLAALREGLGCQ